MTALHRSEQRSARLHAVSLNRFRSSVQRILGKDLQFHPCKIQLVQESKEHGFISQNNFCSVFLTLLNDVHSLFMSDEDHFHLSGYLNKQNFRHWANINPRELHHTPLNSEKVTAW
jgi:hypothetical protein